MRAGDHANPDRQQPVRSLRSDIANHRRNQRQQHRREQRFRFNRGTIKHRRCMRNQNQTEGRRDAGARAQTHRDILQEPDRHEKTGSRDQIARNLWL